MASLAIFIFIFIFILLSMTVTATAGGSKETHIHFYSHTRFSNPNPADVRVLPGQPALHGFGGLIVFDHPLTEGPSLLGSKTIGRTQGFRALASREEDASVQVANFVFMAGPYNGSTFSVVGRRAIMLPSREFVVVGGTGLFRFARGYLVVRTLEVNATTGDATTDMNAYIMH